MNFDSAVDKPIPSTIQNQQKQLQLQDHQELDQQEFSSSSLSGIQDLSCSDPYQLKMLQMKNSLKIEEPINDAKQFNFQEKESNSFLNDNYMLNKQESLKINISEQPTSFIQVQDEKETNELNYNSRNIQNLEEISGVQNISGSLASQSIASNLTRADQIMIQQQQISLMDFVPSQTQSFVQKEIPHPVSTVQPKTSLIKQPESGLNSNRMQNQAIESPGKKQQLDSKQKLQKSQNRKSINSQQHQQQSSASSQRKQQFNLKKQIQTFCSNENQTKAKISSQVQQFKNLQHLQPQTSRTSYLVPLGQKIVNSSSNKMDRLQMSAKSSRSQRTSQERSNSKSRLKSLTQRDQIGIKANRKPLFIIKLEVEVGKLEEIKFFEEDEPEMIAKNFGQKFGLQDDHILLLSQQFSQRFKEEKENKDKLQEQLRCQIKQEIEKEAKEFVERCKSRKHNDSAEGGCQTQRQPVYDRLYNIAVVKQQKQQQNSSQDKREPVFSQNSIIQSQSAKSLFTSQFNNSNTSQSRILTQAYPLTSNTTNQSFINNNVSYCGTAGDRMFLMQTKKLELNNLNTQHSAIKHMGPNTDHEIDNFVDQSYLTDFLHSKLNQSQKTAANQNNQSFVASLNSQLMCGDRAFGPAEDILLDYGKIYQERQNQRLDQNEQQLKEQCTFQPQLDEKRLTKYLQNTHHNPQASQDNGQSKNIHEFLYKEDKMRQNKFAEQQQKIESEIKNQANRSSLSKDKDPNDQIQEITQRLMNISSRKKWFDEKSKEKLKYETKVDQETGQELFKPKISKTDRNQINSERNQFIIQNKENNMSIQECLYLESKVIKQKKEETKQRIYQEQSKVNPSLNPISSSLIEARQQQKLLHLFMALDSDADGLISSENIDLSQLSNKALDAMTDFLIRLEQDKSVLNFAGFLEQISKTMEKLTIVEKEELLGPKRKIKELQTQNTFKPQLSEKTLKLAQKRSKSRGDRDLTDYLSKPNSRLSTHQQFDKTQQINSDLRPNTLNTTVDPNEIKECTFKPKINKNAEVLAKRAKQREKSEKSKQRNSSQTPRDMIKKSLNQPIMERKNQELQCIMRKTINLHIE